MLDLWLIVITLAFTKRDMGTVCGGQVVNAKDCRPQ